MKTRVTIMLKAGVLDPQGRAIRGALNGLGFGGVRDVRAGKVIELDLDDGVSRADVEAMCRTLLANTVIEKYQLDGDFASNEDAGQDRAANEVIESIGA